MDNSIIEGEANFVDFLEVSRIPYSNTELVFMEKFGCASVEVMYFYVCMCIDTQNLPRNKGRKSQLKKQSSTK